MSTNINKKEIWITPGSGVVSKNINGSWSNTDFVSSIHSDSTPMGLLMKSKFPSDTTIRLSKEVSGVPSSWVYWGESPEIDLDYIYEKSSSNLDNLDGIQRFKLSRSQISTRYRKILENSSMKISPRGIKITETPSNINDAIIDIILAIHFVVERETTGSLSGDIISRISRGKLEAARGIRTIVSSKGNNDITKILLYSSYAQPSATAISRIFEVGSIIGVGSVKDIVTKCYKDVHKEQIKSLEKSMREIQKSMK